MGYCPDCGCRTSSGVCSNCQEELFIINEQSEHIDFSLSDEFVNKAKEQKELLKKRKREKI